MARGNNLAGMVHLGDGALLSILLGGFICVTIIACISVAQPVNSAEIVELVKHGVNDEMIIKEIEAAHAVYRLRDADIRNLMKNGVSQRVIAAMIRTPRR